MTISVVIPTKNRYKELLDTIKTVFLQTHLPDEIIIVDQNISSDVKDEVFGLFSKMDEVKGKNIILKYIHNPQIKGLTQARNIAIGKNGSDIVLFLDDDVVMEKDFIFNILKIYTEYPEIYGISGTITNSDRGWIGTILYRVFMIGNFADKRLLIFSNPKYDNVEYITVATLPGGLTSYRREVFNEFMFDENFIEYGLSEDFEFSFRVSRKYKLVITPKARLEHVRSDEGRADNKKLIESVILAKHYFFKKNLDKNIYNYFCYLWLHIGYIIFGVFLAIFRHRVDALAGYFNGLKKLIQGESSDFIKKG